MFNTEFLKLMFANLIFKFLEILESKVDFGNLFKYNKILYSNTI